jgi:hypothetical protein
VVAVRTAPMIHDQGTSQEACHARKPTEPRDFDGPRRPGTAPVRKEFPGAGGQVLRLYLPEVPESLPVPTRTGDLGSLYYFNGLLNQEE